MYNVGEKDFFENGSEILLNIPPFSINFLLFKIIYNSYKNYLNWNMHDYIKALEKRGLGKLKS